MARLGQVPLDSVGRPLRGIRSRVRGFGVRRIVFRRVGMHGSFVCGMHRNLCWVCRAWGFGKLRRYGYRSVYPMLLDGSGRLRGCGRGS